MKTYKIAQFLTDEEKQRVCDATYRDARYGPETPDGCCPMGVAIQPGGRFSKPTATVVAYTLAKAQRGPRAEIELAARAFIRQWDRRQIHPADLPRVLGVAS